LCFAAGLVLCSDFVRIFGGSGKVQSANKDQSNKKSKAQAQSVLKGITTVHCKASQAEMKQPERNDLFE